MSLVPRGKSPCLAKSLCYPLSDGGSKTGSENSGAVFNLSTSIIGAEINAHPVAMKVLGLVLEFVLIISMDISANLLVRLSVLCKAAVYGEVVQYAMGRPATLLSENCLTVNNVGVTVVYLIVLGDVMSGLVHHVEVSDQWLGNGDWSQLMILVVLVLFLVPLCAFKRIDSLNVSSAASVALIVFFDENEEGLQEEDDKEHGDRCCWACEETYAADGFWICYERIQYVTFTTYLGFLLCLLWNIVAFSMTISWIKGEGSRNWLLVTIYFLSKVPGACVLWYRPLYRRGGSVAGQDKKNQTLSMRELLSASTRVLDRGTHVRKGELQILATYSMKRCLFFVKDKNVLHNMCSLFFDGRHGPRACWGYVLAAADTLIRVDKFMAISEDGQILLNAGRDKAVHLWDLHDYGFTEIVPSYEVLEALYLIHFGSSFTSLVASFYEQSGKKTSGSSAIHFITIGEQEIERIWDLFERKPSGVTVNSDMSRDSTSAVMLPTPQGLLCV
jgi:hypothetical protein